MQFPSPLWSFLAGALSWAFSSLRATYFPQVQVGTKRSRWPKTRTLWHIHHILLYKVAICKKKKKAVNSGLNKSKQADKSAYGIYWIWYINLNISTLCYFVLNSNVSCFCDHWILESPPAWCEKLSDLFRHSGRLIFLCAGTSKSKAMVPCHKQLDVLSPFGSK